MKNKIDFIESAGVDTAPLSKHAGWTTEN